MKRIMLKLIAVVILVVLVGCKQSGALDAMGTVAKSCYTSVQNFFGNMDKTPAKEGETGTAAASTVQAYEIIIPDYSGKASVDIPITGRIFTTEWDELGRGEYRLSPLDKLGRCGPAIMWATKEGLPRGERGSTGQEKPSGWVQNKYPGVVDSEPPYLYNRAHLLMWAISGLTDTRENLVTGTRYFNTVSMLPTETDVVRFIEKGNDVMYRVTPIFEGDNLLATGVLMEAESKDGSFQIRRFAYNVQPGVVIDYATGKNHLEAQAETTSVAQKYVLNKNTKKFHLLHCESVSKISAKNKVEVEATRERLIEQGYSPCGACSP